MLNKKVSNTIFWVLGITQPGIEPSSPGPLANTLTNMLMSGLMSRVLANGLEDRGSIPGRVIKDSKMVLDSALLNTKHYKVRVKGKVEQSSEWSRDLPYTSE